MSKARRLDSTLKNTESDHELDWSDTVRCIKEWSDDELLNHLSSNAFTIPPRDYNPSTPFVYVKTEDGLTTILPHGYRLPLMFIAKYQWETTIRTLSTQHRQRWEAVRENILHLSRLCHVLFLKARAKAESSGMEKGWRCVMFDRVITRFYKGWTASSPSKVEYFLSRFGSGVYEGDILKHDWKRWVLKGFFRSSQSPTMHLTEEEVKDGITAVDFKIGLSKINNIWMLITGTKNDPIRRPIMFMQTTDRDNSSELAVTNLDKDNGPVELPPIANPNPPPPNDTPTKRGRETSEDDDNNNDRSGKRLKLEEIIRSLSSQPCTALDLSDGLGSGGVVGEKHGTLPHFRVPRQTLSSHGWKRRSLTDASPRYPHREGEEAEAEASVVPPCGFENSSASTPTPPNLTSTTTSHPPIPLDHPSNDIVHSNANPATSSPIAPNNDSLENSLTIIPPPPPTSSLNDKTPIISLTTPAPTSVSSKSKEKQPKSAPTTITIPTPIGTSSRNSTHVSKQTPIRVITLHANLSPAPESAPTSVPSKSKEKEPESTPTCSTTIIPIAIPTVTASTSISPRNSALVFKRTPKRVVTLRARHSSPPELAYPLLSSPLTEGGGGGGGEGTSDTFGSPVVNSISKVIHESSSVQDMLPLTKRQRKALGLSGRETERDKDVKTEEKRKGKKNTMKGKRDEKSKKSSGIQNLLPLSSSSSSLPGAPSNSTTNNNKNNSDGRSEMTTTTTTTTISTTSAATPDTILGVHAKTLAVSELEPERVLMANSSGAVATSSISLPSLPIMSGLSESAITNSDGGGVAAAIGAGAKPGSEPQQSKDKPREMKDLTGVVGRLEILKGVQAWDSVRGCAIGGDGGSSGHPGFVSQTAEKEKENVGMMMDVSESGAMPGYVNAAVEVGASVMFKDVYVQTDELGHVYRPNVASTITAATPLPEVDEPSNTRNLRSPPPQPKDDETSINPTNLSTVVDNLVSAKMISMMQTLVKSGTNANTKTRPTETNTTTESSDSDNALRQHQRSPSSPSLSVSASHSMDAYDNIMANLLDELKTIKEEARCREQNGREELLAMRQLHSAEVDALRKRLSYLESRNLSLGSGSGSGSGWRGSSLSMRVDSPLDLDMEDGGNKAYHSTSFRQRQFGDRSRIHHGSISSSTVNPEGELSRTINNIATTTTTISTPQSSYTPLSFKKANPSTDTTGITTTTAAAGPTTMTNNTMLSSSSSLSTPPTGANSHHGMDLDDDDGSNSISLNNPLPSLPLPVKSQRKHHIMALARTHFS